MNTSAAFWKSFPRKSIAGFLLGVFFIFSALGFVNDIMQMGQQPQGRLILGVLVSGLFAVLYALSFTLLRRQFWKAFVPVFVVHMLVVNLIGHAIPNRTAMSSSDLQNRLVFDGTSTTFCVALGYACFVYVSITAARRYARVHAEIVLATEIHRVLVPPIDTRIDHFAFHGRSLPSGEVGGDLIDVFPHGRVWIAYIADVSGHGVAPGVVMAMVKSAARMQLSSKEDSTDLFERLNDVLYPIKKPEMFVTFAYLAWDGERLYHSLAGHPPILHFHAATGEVTESACSNLPVGMFARQQFVREPVTFAPGDRFLLYTDGLLEIANAKDEEFGLAGLKAAFAAHARDTAQANLDAIIDAANRHGRAEDDRSLLLICC